MHDDEADDAYADQKGHHGYQSLDNVSKQMMPPRHSLGCTIKLSHKQVLCLDILQHAPELLFRVRLKSYNRLKLPLADHFKKCVKREIPVPDREMFIKESVIVMDMDLADAGP
jgi:hypothetical protein